MARPKRDMQRVNYYVQRNVLQGLAKLSELRGSTASELVRTALRAYVMEELTKEQAIERETATE